MFGGHSRAREDAERRVRRDGAVRPRQDRPAGPGEAQGPARQGGGGRRVQVDDEQDNAGAAVEDARRGAPRRRVQHATPADGRRHDRRLLRRRHDEVDALAAALLRGRRRRGRTRRRLLRASHPSRVDDQHPRQRALQGVLLERGQQHGGDAQGVLRVPAPGRQHVRRAHRVARRFGDEPADAGGALLLRRALRSGAADGAPADAGEDLEGREPAQGSGEDHRADRIRRGAHQDVRAVQVQGEGAHHLKFSSRLGLSIQF
mmetsp:Transcript_4133/g.15325  ORF Transcript_4133/g.15325 Transcript_4133/m.15325 type:complete len:260 (-) Transcript_4133:22-801(-)